MSKKQTHQYNIDAFLKEDNISYYLLGAFCADGCISKRENTCNINISSKDKEWLETIKNIICSTRKIHKISTVNCYRFDFNNQIIYDWLIKNKCTPRKSLTLEHPRVPNKYLLDFIRGIIDGDGSIGLYKNSKNSKTGTITIASASKKFVDSIRKSLLKFKIKSQLRIVLPESRKNQSYINGQLVQSKNIVYYVRITGKNSFDLINLIYYSDDVLCLKRKLREANKIRKYFATHKFKVRWPTPNKKYLLNELNTKSIKQICKEYKVTDKIIYKWMKAHNIPKFGLKIRSKLFRGTKNHWAKLTESDVKIIKAESAKNVARIILAKKFNVSSNTISSIVCGKTWKHIK